MTRIATIVPIKDEEPETVLTCAKALLSAEEYLKLYHPDEYLITTYFVVESEGWSGSELLLDTEPYVTVLSDVDIEHVLIPADTRAGGVRSNVGRARNVGLQYATRHCTSPNYVFTTDSDSTVDRQWYSAHLGILTAVVGGEDVAVSHGGVCISHTSPRAMAWEAYLCSDNSGNDVFEQNMAFNAEALLRSGGFAQLTHGEGRATINRVRRFGPEVRHNNTYVMTSDRTLGKVPHGFAELLSRL